MLRCVHRTIAQYLYGLAMVIVSSCADSTDAESGDSAASSELVQSACRSYATYVDACMIETDGFGEDACNALYAKHYRTDVVTATKRCYDDAAAGSCDRSACLEARELGLTAAQNPNEPTVKACVARLVQCTGSDDNAPRCEQVLLYTKAGREAALHCFTEAVACGDLRDCIRLPDSF